MEFNLRSKYEEGWYDWKGEFTYDNNVIYIRWIFKGKISPLIYPKGGNFSGQRDKDKLIDGIGK